MSRAKRLQIVLDLAQQNEDKAAEALEMARKSKEIDEQKLRDLIQYYEDYESSFRRPQIGIRADEMQRQRSFLVQLADAKEQQSDVVEQRLLIFLRKQQHWQTAHLKRKTLQELIDSCKQDEARQLSKKEEQMLDEWFNQTAPQRLERPLFI